MAGKPKANSTRQKGLQYATALSVDKMNETMGKGARKKNNTKKK